MTETNILLCCAVQIDKQTTLTDLCTLNTAVIKAEYTFWFVF